MAIAVSNLFENKLQKHFNRRQNDMIMVSVMEAKQCKESWMILPPVDMAKYV